MSDLTSISDRVARTLVDAGTTFRPDQLAAYHRALSKENGKASKWVLRQIIENAEAGAEKRLPLCDDTGIPHILIEVGSRCALPAGFLEAVESGIAKGLRELPGRPMAVLGDETQRISQSVGLAPSPDALLPAPIQIIRASADLPQEEVRVTVLMYGGGPEIRGKTLRVFHKHSLDVVADEMVAWASESAKLLGCQPCIFTFGIGRSNYEAAALSMQAMAQGNFNVQSEFERRITDAVNASEIGSLGLGGDITLLATFIKVGEQRASGIRVVSMRAGCCFDPRRATISFKF